MNYRENPGGIAKKVRACQKHMATPCHWLMFGGKGRMNIRILPGGYTDRDGKDAMIFAVTDKDGTVCVHKYAMRPAQFSS